ncbi:DUF29 domain-containing protein [Methylobacterium radiodurans]|uniref:DUF29 domain-containing protein n=1 Tax=Methylobacterium radiodurans TaxID=2202828 RepID=A0A2U8VTX2_9HYPH|nr:DUF29 domain-containing protein [Methylobacterium radiodurans]AWN36722.1 DUF29 domain-containing protein [Methylobacterium radiodurans]
MSAVKAAARPQEAGTAYEDDFYTWTQEQGARLRAGDFAGLDLENLAEEIETLGRTEFNSLVSAWRVILLHMLKWDHQPERRTRSWAISIRTHRNRAADVLKDNPGLKSRLTDSLVRAYRDARDEASGETGLPIRVFPTACPYTREEMLARPFPADPDDTTD